MVKAKAKNDRAPQRGILFLPVLILGLLIGIGVWSGRIGMEKEARQPASESAPLAPQPAQSLQEEEAARLPSSAAAPRDVSVPSGQGRWTQVTQSGTQHLKREHWQLQVSGFTVYPLRERVVSRLRTTGAVVGESGEPTDLRGPRAPSGEFKLTAQDARVQAQTAWTEWGPAGGPHSAERVEKIAWAEDRTEGAESRLAYRVSQQGRETVVDATTGEVLFRADRRIRN